MAKREKIMEVIQGPMGALKPRKPKPLTSKEVQVRAREDSDLAMLALREILISDEASHTNKLRAAELVLDRGFGRPKQTTLNVSMDNDAEPKKLSASALRSRIEAALDGIEQAERGAEEEGEGEERPPNIRELN